MNAKTQAVIFFIFACVFLCSTSAVFADGDGECEKDPPNAKAALKRAKEAETAGKTVQAFLLYEKIWFCVDKNGPKEVEAGKKRILRKFALAQGKKGIIHSSTEYYFKHLEDAHCAKLDKQRMDEDRDEAGDGLKGPDNECLGGDRAEFDESSGAFDILWRAGHDYGEADAVLMKGVRAMPKDLYIVKFAVEHFSGEAARTEGYTPDPAYSRELRRITAQNTEDLLVKEDKTFQDKTITLSITDELAGYSPAGRSLKLLKDAKDWASLVDKQLVDKVIARAKKRGGDTLEIDKKSPSHLSLSEAISFYKFAGDDDTVRKLKVVADKRGEQSASKGDATEAVYYFRISENNKRADEVSAEMKKSFEKNPLLKSPSKGKKERKQFKKETDDMEKELGM